jgi:putative FmdB family regulatory protein|nr:zinc ribbon domain-containing protein [Deltaproteobacteria bacterium]
MPIYEYRCKKCGKISSHLVLNRDDFKSHCKHCGSGSVTKLISRVNVRLSEETRMDKLADPSMLAGLDENDPKSMAKWMKKMGSLAGDNLDEDFDRMVDEAMEEAAQEEKSVGPDSNMPDGLSSSVTDSTAI